MNTRPKTIKPCKNPESRESNVANPVKLTTKYMSYSSCVLTSKEYLGQ
jgi:hypothetical protein